MIETRTTKKESNGEKGNCLAASLSSVLEMPLSLIPEFEDMHPSEWRNNLLNWAHSIGYKISFTTLKPSGYAIGVGVHPFGGLHAVVLFNGEFCFDPNSKELFYDEHRYYIQITQLSDNQFVA